MTVIGGDHAHTPGYVACQVPFSPRIGIDVAVLDTAQGFLLVHLAEWGVPGDRDLQARDGPPARKLFAGRQGRFSTD